MNTSILITQFMAYVLGVASCAFVWYAYNEYRQYRFKKQQRLVIAQANAMYEAGLSATVAQRGDSDYRNGIGKVGE